MNKKTRVLHRRTHGASPRRITPLLLFAWISTAWGQPPVVDHDIRVTLAPDSGSLRVSDTIVIPEPGNGSVDFLLHAGLDPEVDTTGVRLSELERIDGAVPLQRYRLRFASSIEQPHGPRTVTLRYGGSIRHRPGERVEGAGKRTQGTAGYIGADGVYLSGASGWYPRFGDERIRFALEIHPPQGWDVVSQGSREELDQGAVRWVEEHPQESIYLVSSRYRLYRRDLEPAAGMVFLRQPNDALAERYLDATSRYLQLYSSLIAPYPYAKFALVENFWESGYGMASFTLLGPRVIRLPFIVHTSYPHEILHNWWGNGVYVDYREGNWSEGLTAYMADHLLRAMRGRGEAYRRDTLQKYAEYAADQADRPLARFRARHGEASQAIGYGKGLMLFHMLRMRMGDQAFISALRDFYQRHRFKAAGFSDLRAAFEGESRTDLTWFFEQWLHRTGAPALHIDFLEPRCGTGGCRLIGRLVQTQPGPAYRLEVPLAVGVGADKGVVEKRLSMVEKTLAIDLPLPGKPRWAAVDPHFDLFRRVAPDELPPSLDRLFGAERLTLILPSRAPPDMREAYAAVAEHWAEGSDHVEVRWDETLDGWPEHGAVWVFGWRNRWRDTVAEALPEPGDLNADNAKLAGTGLKRANRSAVVATVVEGRAAGWVGAVDPKAAGALGRKLPHYGKYGYLAFSGSSAENTLKGQWPVTGSPLVVRFEPGAVIPKLAPHPPLTAVLRR